MVWEFATLPVLREGLGESRSVQFVDASVAHAPARISRIGAHLVLLRVRARREFAQPKQPFHLDTIMARKYKPSPIWGQFRQP